MLFVFGHIFGQGSLAEAGLDTFKGMNLVWQDEFNQPGPPDPTIWRHEQGFKRNNELQWYQPENASCHDGILIIEAKRVVRQQRLADKPERHQLYLLKHSDQGSSSMALRDLRGSCSHRYPGRILACHLDPGNRRPMALEWRDRYHGIL